MKYWQYFTFSFTSKGIWIIVYKQDKKGSALNKDVEIGVRRIIGETLLTLRRQNNIYAGKFCEQLGLSSKQYAELEQGSKIMNLPRYLQCLATLGAWVEIHTSEGTVMDTRGIYEVPAMRPNQIEKNEINRQQSFENHKKAIEKEHQDK